jgi:hypothetical protein
MATKKKIKKVRISNHDRRPRDVLTDVFLVAAIPAAAYMIAFSYEKGFAYFFGIPAQLIDISLTRLLIMVTGATFVVIWALLVLSDWNILKRKSQSNLQFHRHQFGLMFCTGVFIMMYFFNFYWVAWLSFIGAMGVFLIRQFVPPLIMQRDKKTYNEKYEAQLARRKEKMVLTGLAIKRFGRGAYDLFWFFFASLGVAWFAGAYHAKSQEEFYILSQPTELVVLRIYGNTLITAPFDRKTKQVKPEVLIYNVTKDVPLKLRKETVGPLHLHPREEL